MLVEESSSGEQPGGQSEPAQDLVPSASNSVLEVQPDSQAIIDNMTRTSSLAEKFALQRIDTAIERLQNLREMVQKKCRQNIESTIEFVQLLEAGLRETERLQMAADKIGDAAIST